jgi:hypothetical protein
VPEPVSLYSLCAARVTGIEPPSERPVERLSPLHSWSPQPPDGQLLHLWWSARSYVHGPRA